MFSAGRTLMTVPVSGAVDNTMSLLHFNGSNGATTLTDDKGNSWTNSSSLALSTTRQKFGSASLRLGSSPVFIYTSGSQFDNGGLKSFTSECWFRPDGSTGSDWFTVLSTRISGLAYPTFMVGQQQSGMRVGISNAAFSSLPATYYSGVNPSLGNWNHLAVVGDGTNIKIYLNGTSFHSGITTQLDCDNPICGNR